MLNNHGMQRIFQGTWDLMTLDIVHYADGESLTLSTDLTRLKREIERFEGIEGFSGFLRFLDEAHTHYEASVDHVLHRNFSTLLSLLRPAFLAHIFALHPFTTIVSVASWNLSITSI